MLLKSRGRGTQSAIPNCGRRSRSQAARGSTLRERDAEKDYNSFFALHQFSVAWVGAPGARAQSLTRPDRASASPFPRHHEHPNSPTSARVSVRATPPPERDLARCCRCSPLKDADRSVLNAEADTGRFLILPFSHLIRKIEERTVPFFPTTRFLLFSHPPLRSVGKGRKFPFFGTFGSPSAKILGPAAPA